MHLLPLTAVGGKATYYMENARVLPPRTLVIFGGPDRCGKTTIARELSRRTGAPYFKPTGQAKYAMSQPSVFRLQTLFGEPKLADFLAQTGHSAILDRGFPCDYAYTHALGRLRNMSFAEASDWSDTIKAMDATYGMMDALLVICVRSDYTGRSDPSWPEMDGKMMAILDSYYREYAAETKMRKLVLNVDDENLDRQVSEIIRKLDNPWER
jgi:hypothetical protein